ncbi:Uncharacterised protein [Niallia circulans]|jgi:maltose-binding protein MalE|uniref:hypothetical protein n=1 Tax=Shouchella clausii TaxID=79880 RepID=UPI000BA6E9EC|nr:hypothetical protein [Shouchella clausii]MCM3549396.1 hypothetical protein [Shouchella clausii]PAF14163.1 hypothetical protein CHH59_10285 [Shouchella clausii]SPU22408.1 Uncharacterised protein [Niallia circulans]
MKKNYLLVTLGLVSAITLSACGDSEDTNASDKNNDTEQETTENAESETSSSDESESEENEEGLTELNQEIVDNDNFTATLVSIEQIYDDMWDEEKIEVTFEIENKRDDAIEVQAREVSADGKMIDEALISMSTEVASGKLADAVLTIQDYEGGELPSLEENFEMLLHVFSWDNPDFEEQAEVKVTFE